MKLSGRPRKGARESKSDSMKIRLTEPEKAAFRRASELSGIGLSTWMRERLRRAAIRELEEAGEIAAFLLPRKGS
jgi:hypothetical protein